MAAEYLEVYSDRIPVEALRLSNDALAGELQEWSLGKIKQKHTVHFCGLVQTGPDQQAVFLPRGMEIPKDEGQRVKAAAMTLQALARYGDDATNRQFEDDGLAGNPGGLSVITRLAEDFRKFGLFIERQRVRTRNVGKPDWKRTISRNFPYISDAQEAVYFDVATTRTTDSSENLLAEIQAAVMAEIMDRHGWWLSNLTSRKSSLFRAKMPLAKREIWVKTLNAILPSLYSRRAIFLATYLAFYLKGDRGSDAGQFVFGVEDFQTVWEAMLRHTLRGVELNWNARLPKPSYVVGRPASHEESLIGMKTDLIVKDCSGYTVADAKYYAATSARTAPPWADIVKQFVYEDALRSVIGSSQQIRNCFVFPAPHVGEARLQKVHMKSGGGDVVDKFPTIECLYLEMHEVIRSYCGHRTDLELPAV